MGASLEEGRLAYLALLAELPAGGVDDDAAPCRVELQLATRWSELFAQRPALFQLLARQFNQVAAERRLQSLDERFPPPAAASRPGNPKRWRSSSGPLAAVASITRRPLP